jgi:putative transposase
MASTATSGHRALRKGRVSLAGQVYVVTTVVSNRVPLFADFALAVAACRALHRTTRSGGLEPVCWVLMPDHLHLLARLVDCDLSHEVGYLKARIAHAVNDERGVDGCVWSRGFHDRALRRDQDLRARAAYIVANPVRAGLVASARTYPFWDAIWL